MRCSSGPKKGFNIRWKLNYCWHLTRVAVVLSSTLWPTGPLNFMSLEFFLQCIHHSMLNKTTQNMWHDRVGHFVVGSRYLIPMAWWLMVQEEITLGSRTVHSWKQSYVVQSVEKRQVQVGNALLLYLPIRQQKKHIGVFFKKKLWEKWQKKNVLWKCRFCVIAVDVLSSRVHEWLRAVLEWDTPRCV